MTISILFKFATIVTSWIFLKFIPVQGFQIRSQSRLMYPRRTVMGTPRWHAVAVVIYFLLLSVSFCTGL
jgi:hypothetical protein